ncbi:hypothetical protein AJ80_06314 [Polytolypa hystricis UAMH7299]|uniref:Outer spore wall protein RRT8 n=1 Tax=Polytolypa hystricis (strain UAMH7299) TaxID=1447883 RepID=A0A2B7XWW8_POLH7|nr:hypothetical protein AJ80_06314 [Polytolypa hystricis UAMH7299]
MAEAIKAIALEEANNIKTLVTDGLRSGTYSYPFLGILYFGSHHSLWGPLRKLLAPIGTLSLVVTSGMFFFTYVPQVAILAFISGPFAPFAAIPLILSESSTIIKLLARVFMLEESLIDTFDGTMIARGHSALVAKGRVVKSSSASSSSSSASDPMAKLGKLVKKPLGKLSMTYLVRSLIYFPLNFIPVVGTFMYLATQGRRLGPVAHARYFQLKGWDAKRREEWVKAHRAEYTSFGAAAFLLEMIPFASIAFSYSNTVGAALWASNIENNAVEYHEE